MDMHITFFVGLFAMINDDEKHGQVSFVGLVLEGL